VTDFAFLHGGGQGSWVWTETVDALKLQTNGAARTLGLDAPGCGVKRGQDTSEIDVDDVAVELIADIEAADLGKVVLVGHSQAGSTIPRMALKRPDLFSRLIYVSCSSPLPGKTILQMMDEEVGWPKDRSFPAYFRTAFCNDMSEDETKAFIARHGGDNWPMKSYAFTDWRYDHLGQIPASYVLCLRDGILPVAWQDKFAERFKAERIIRVDAGHQVQNTRPHALAEILRQEAL
jgi:pimeloyl-ACP methyl ester carboxylesterase